MPTVATLCRTPCIPLCFSAMRFAQPWPAWTCQALCAAGGLAPGPLWGARPGGSVLFCMIDAVAVLAREQPSGSALFPTHLSSPVCVGVGRCVLLRCACPCFPLVPLCVTAWLLSFPRRCMWHSVTPPPPSPCGGADQVGVPPRRSCWAAWGVNVAPCLRVARPVGGRA